MCARICTLPGRTERAQLLVSSRIVAPLGNSFSEGPKHPFSFKWLFTTYSGLIYVQFYLWLIKDWSWSQLHWFWPGMICGTLVLVHGFLLIVLGFLVGAYSESLIGMGVFLWIFANYWWMIGELWQYQINLDSPRWLIPQSFFLNETEGPEMFYEKQTKEAKVLSLIALLWLFVVICILPLCYNDRDSPFIRSINQRAPPPRFQLWFRDWVEYESFHVLSWSFKDTMWVWGSKTGYAIGFMITCALTTDIIWILWSHSGQWVELFHYFALFCWIFANGTWAIGELLIEAPHDDEIPQSAWKNYNFIPPESEYMNFFWGRNVAGYFFMLAAIILVVFYIYWICCAKIHPLHMEDAGRDDNFAPIQAQSTPGNVNETIEIPKQLSAELELTVI